MGKLLLSLLVVFITTVGFWFFASEYQKDKVAALFDSSLERQCFEYHRSELKDPETAYLVNNGALRDLNLLKEENNRGEKLIAAEVRAKNSYGAYGIMRIECVASSEKINEAATLLMELRNEM